jgi:antitoxin YefM
MRIAAVDVLTFSETRASLKSVMDRVVDDHVPVIIARRNTRSVVMVSLEDWNEMEATMHLLSTRANTEQLMASIAEADAGQLEEHELIEP